MDGTHENYGLLLDQEIAKLGPRTVYRSRENVNGDHPYLEICYNLNSETICVNVEPIGDALIHETSPDSSWGYYTLLGTGWYGNIWDGEKQSLLMFDLEPAPPEDCEDCRGKVTELTLQYNGGSPGQVMIKQKNNDVVFNSFLLPGDVFNIVGTDNGTFGTEIKIYVDGNENAKIHTSCSKPIGPGLVKGDFQVIEGYSKDGGLLCPIPPPPPPGSDWCDGAKAKALLVEYTGQDYSFTSHNQDPSKVECSGDPLLAPTVRILAQDKANPNDNRAKVWFDGQVDLNSTFWIDATNAGENKLKAETHVFIYDLQDNLLQTIEFHTSCSQPLGAGDQFGSILMMDFVPE